MKGLQQLHSISVQANSVVGDVFAIASGISKVSQHVLFSCNGKMLLPETTVAAAGLVDGSVIQIHMPLRAGSGKSASNAPAEADDDAYDSSALSRSSISSRFETEVDRTVFAQNRKVAELLTALEGMVHAQEQHQGSKQVNSFIVSYLWF